MQSDMKKMILLNAEANNVFIENREGIIANYFVFTIQLLQQIKSKPLLDCTLSLVLTKILSFEKVKRDHSRLSFHFLQLGKRIWNDTGLKIKELEEYFCRLYSAKTSNVNALKYFGRHSKILSYWFISSTTLSNIIKTTC